MGEGVGQDGWFGGLDPGGEQPAAIGVDGHVKGVLVDIEARMERLAGSKPELLRSRTCLRGSACRGHRFTCRVRSQRRSVYPEPMNAVFTLSLCQKSCDQLFCALFGRNCQNRGCPHLCLLLCCHRSIFLGFTRLRVTPYTRQLTNK
jgi:hypothetical protein